MMQAETHVFPLSSLRLSPLNARQARDPTKVQDLVASIRSVGQIQNLSITIGGTRKKPIHEVVAGGRRLLAFEVLRELGDLPKDHPVKCEVVDAAKALEISTAENTQREPMTPIEEFRAFARLREEGIPVEDIAARFGATPLAVSRRLRLAALSPKLLALHETRDITLDQLMALTVSDDHEKQEECWFTSAKWNRDPSDLRERLTGGQPTTEDYPGFKLIGADAYRGAGGTLTTDLFAEHGGYINDVELVDRLVAERLEAKAAELREAGWATVDVEAEPSHDHNLRHGKQPLRKGLRDLNDEETEKLDALTERIDSIGKDLEALTEQIEAGDVADEDEALEKVAEMEDQITDLEQQRDTMSEGLAVYSNEQKQVGYCIVYLNRSGEIGVIEGLLAKGQKDPSPAPQNEGGRGLGLGSGTSGGSKGFHGEKLVQLLTTERSLAWQAVLMADPSLALLAALEKLVPCCIGDLYVYGGDKLKLSASTSTDNHLYALTDADNTPAASSVRAVIQFWTERYQAHMQGDESTTLGFLIALTVDERLALHAVCVAMTLDVKQHQDHTQQGDEFSRHCGLDMRQWWTPTAKRYFLMLSKKQILQVLGEAGAPVAGLDKLKKDELAAKADALMQTHAQGWLPTPLRG